MNHEQSEQSTALEQAEQAEEDFDSAFNTLLDQASIIIDMRRAAASSGHDILFELTEDLIDLRTDDLIEAARVLSQEYLHKLRRLENLK